jgi:hypothetical protein
VGLPVGVVQEKVIEVAETVAPLAGEESDGAPGTLAVLPFMKLRVLDQGPQPELL